MCPVMRPFRLLSRVLVHVEFTSGFRNMQFSLNVEQTVTHNCLQIAIRWMLITVNKNWKDCTEGT